MWLTAAQNPWQAGKRERLSDAFLSQFSIMHFKELPRDEWREIVEKKIGEGRDKDPEIIRKLAKQMTDFHCDVRAKISEGCSEKGSYATVTNRELLMWTDMVLAEEQIVRAEEKLGDHAWLIYGCRFRGDGRQLVQKVICDHNLAVSSAGSRLEDAIERFSSIQAPCRRKDITLVDQFWTTHFSSKPFPDEDMRNAFDVCASVHRAVLKKIQSSDFMKTFGVYTTFSESWLAKWIADALEDRLLGTDDWMELGRLGAKTYCSRIRHEHARRDVFGIFAQQFDLDLGDVPTMSSSVPEMPVVLSDQTCQHLVSVAEAIRSEQPVLIEGTAGSGKTCLGKVIAFLLGNHYEQVTLTQESEPSAMLGECLPSSSPGGERIVQWRDGPLTRAFVEGSVCIVDNIGQAEPVLQERINPVLESPKVLCLTERGDTEPLRCRVLADGTRSITPGPARGFQFIATFTPKGVAARGMDILSKELTAALFNRFVIIHIDDPANTPDDEFRLALEAMIRCCLPKERCEASLREISDYCLKIRHYVSENTQMFLSFRDFATLIDVATVLMIQRPDVEDQVALHCAMTVTFAAQMRDGDAKLSLCSEMGCPISALGQLKLLDGFEKSSDLVLTESRRRHAQAVLLGALVNKPVLLEGKPAAGKTALVLGLKQFGGSDKKVRILSNSDTATIQDYFGTWIPSDSGFSFQKGVLVQAMESGDWFVSDEFNLAPVAVIAALMPFLEGNCTVQIPGSDMRVGVHPDFRFFATQNPSRGGNDGRKQLPITVRNRFLAVDVEDFPRDELPEIISDKFKGGRYEGIAEGMDSDALAELYFASADGLRLTMRDIIKIVRRYKLLRDEKKQGVSWAAAAMSLLGPRATTREEKARLVHLIASSFGSGAITEAKACAIKYIKQERQGVSFFQEHLRVHFPGFKLDNSPLWRDSLSGNGPPAVFQDTLVDLAFAIKANEPVLLYGESAFKTELIKTWLELSGMTERVQRVHLTSQSEATDLIGQVQLVSFVDVLSSLASTGDFVFSYLDNKLAVHPRSMETLIKSTYVLQLRQSWYRRVLRFKCELCGDEFDPGNEDRFSAVNLSDSIATDDADDQQTKSNDKYEDDYSEFGFEDSLDHSDDSETDEHSVNGSEDSRMHEKEHDVRASMSAWPEGRDEDLDSPREKSAELTEDDHLTLIDDVILRIPGLVKEILEEEIPAAVKRMLHRLEQLRMFIRSRDAQNSKPCFLFRDGPFVKAITMEHAFVVEDYDLCAQAVTERLNSALEVDPTFSIPEDVSFSDRVAAEMEIPKKGYCFIATSHLDSANKKPQLSAATQSRLTQIRVPVYGTADIMSIAEEKLRCKLHASDVEWLPYVMDSIRRVRSEVVGDDPEHPCEDFRGILRWITFVTEHPRNLSVQKRCMLGAKFFYLEEYPADIQNEVLRKVFTDEFEKLQADLALPMGENPFEIQETAGDAGRVVSLAGPGLSLTAPPTLETPSGDDRLPELSLCVTASVRENMARIFASICTSSPLLLEGAPGIGKTAVITQVARFLGTDLERINCSSDTSVEQLYGSVMPMYVNNRRVFEWRDGKLLKALKSQKWILLDEVNLLPAQVLESLVPLLNGSAEADGFTVPGKLDSEPIAVRGTRIFATMNPAAEGGGRAKLSRSIKNTFTTVQIEGYDDDDLQQILKKQFEGLKRKKLVGEEDLRHVFDVYKKVEQSVEKGEIQGANRKHRLNLRDLKSVHDIVAGNIETQISHHRLMACDDDAEESEQDFDKKPVVTSVIRKALQLVFKHRFDNRSAEEQIQHTIDGVVKPPQMELEQKDILSIDLSVGDLVRIGNVYMEKDEARASRGSLVHTVKTIRQLELLATASQSQRAVLLEGPTCSKKTSLVKELASLAGVPLLKLSLHRDFEVSDLIGQWLPVAASDIASELSKRVFRLRDDVARLGLRIAEKAPQKKRVDFYKAMQASYAKGSKTATSQEMKQVVESVKLALETLKGCNMKKWQSLMRAANELMEDAMSSEDASSSTVFKFVESDLIRALKSGSFILFDNINAASPDVIERLLSLFEETPFLSLYEHSESEELKPGAGIHTTTRIFATADRKKINTFGLSNPLLNRMIKIWLPEIDGDVIDLDLRLLETHETVEIASEALGSVEGGNVAAILAVAFHARVRQLVQTSEITISRDSKISFRMLQQAISVIRTWLDKGEPLFNAVVWGLWRVYAAVVETDKDLKKLQQAIHKACKDTASLPLHKFYFVSRGRDALTPFQKESRDLQFVFASLLHACMKHLLKHIQNARLDAETSRTLSVSLWNYLTRLHGHGTENAFNIAEGARTVPELIQFCRDHGGPLSEYFKDISEKEEKILKYFCRNPDRLISQTKEFISNSAFTDWQQRKAFLGDMCSVLDTLFRILDVQFRDRNHEFECIRELFQKISQIKHLPCCFFPLEKEAFGKEVRVLETHLSRCTDRAFKYNLQKRLSEVICEADTKLSCSIVRLMRSTDASRPERNRTGIAFALNALDWKTTLLLPEGLLVSAREDFCAFEILDIQKNLSRLRIMKEVGQLLAKLPLRDRGGQSMLGSMAKAGGRMAQKTWQFLTEGSSSNTSGPSTSNTPEANEEDGDDKLVHSAMEQLDLILGSSDSSFALSDELNAAVDFHIDFMSYLLEDRRRSKNPELNKGDIRNCRELFDRLRHSSRRIARSEFCLPWIALFESSVKIDVPYKIVRCSQEDLRSEIFERGVPASAALLVGDLDSGTSLSDLVSLVLFEKEASGSDSEKTHVNVLHYTYSKESSSNRKWIQEWMKNHEDTYTFSFSNKKLLPVESLPRQRLSRLGITIIACLSTLATYGKDCTMAGKETSVVKHRFISSLEKQMNSYLIEISTCPIKKNDNLFHHLLQVDARLLQSQRQGLTETRQKLSECLRVFSDTKLSVEKSKVEKALDGLKEKLMSSGWQSTAIAFSFRNLMAKLANYPVQELTLRMKELLRQVESRFGDYFLAMDMIAPILKLKKLLTQYAAECLDVDDSSVWKKCNDLCHFVSEVVKYFVDFLMVKDDKMELNRSKPLEDFDQWQEALGKLTAGLEIPVSLLRENELEDIFLTLKNQFKQQLEAENAEASLAKARLLAQVEEVLTDTSTVLESKADVQLSKVKGLKREFQSIWMKARNQFRPTTSVMQEAVKAVQALDRLKGDELNDITLARYENRLQNLSMELDKPQLEETDTRQSTISRDLLDLLSKRSQCMEAADFSLAHLHPNTCSSSEYQQLQTQLRRLEEAVPQKSNTKEAIEYLMHLASKRQKHSLLQQALEALCQCRKLKNTEEGRRQLRGLSSLHIFTDQISNRLAFESDRDSYNELLDCAVAELFQKRAQFLVEECFDMLVGWKSGKVERSLEAVLSLRSPERLSMLHANSVLEEVDGCINQLQQGLASLTALSEGGLCLASPSLSVEDVAVLFSVSPGFLYDFMLNPGETRDQDSASVRFDSPTNQQGGLLSMLVYRQEDGSQLPVFDRSSNEVDRFLKAMKSVLVAEWGENASQDEDDLAVQEIFVAFHFVLLPIVCWRQEFTHLESTIKLASSEPIQKKIDDLEAFIGHCQKSIQNLRNQLSQKELEQERGMYPVEAEESRLKKAIKETENEMERKKEELSEAKKEADLYRSGIYGVLVKSLQDLLAMALVCFCKTVESNRLESLLGDGKTTSVDMLRSAYKVLLREVRSSISKKQYASFKAEQEFEQWRQSCDEFCEEQLKKLSNEDPLRKAAKILCRCAFIGNQRALQRMSSASKSLSKSTFSLVSLGEKTEDLAKSLMETCTNDYRNGSEIEKLSEDLLQLEQKCGSLRKECEADDPISLDLAYLRKLILHSVSCCCSYAHQMHPMTWYTETLLPRLEGSVEEKVLLSMPSSDEEELKVEMKLLPCSWASHRTSLQTSVVEGSLVNPFQLTYVLEQCFAVNAPLYQSVSYAGRHLIDGILELRKLSVLTVEESRCFESLISQLLKMCGESLPVMTVKQTHQSFSELSARIIQLTGVMLQTRKHPRPYLTDYLGRICEQWWYESTSMCLQKLPAKHAPTVETLSQRISDAVSNRTPLEEHLLLSDFRDLSKLRETFRDKRMDLVSVKLSDTQINYLYVFSSVLSQLPFCTRPRLLHNWRMCQAFSSARMSIEEYDKFLKAHHDLLGTDVPKILRSGSAVDQETEIVIAKACSVLHHLCAGICQEVTGWVQGLQSDIQQVVKDADVIIGKCAAAYGDYDKSVSLFLDARHDKRRRTQQNLWQWVVSLTQRQQHLCPELVQIARNLCSLYSEFWRAASLYFKHEGISDWYTHESSGVPHFSRSLDDILKKQHDLYQRKHITDCIKLAAFGLKRVVIQLDIVSLDLDSFLQLDDALVQIGVTEGGTGRVHSVKCRDDLEKELPISYTVTDEASFTLTLEFTGKDRDPFTKRLKLTDLSRPIKFEVGGVRSQNRRPSVSFGVIKKTMFVNPDPSPQEEALCLEAYSNLLSDLSEEMRTLFAEYDKHYKELRENVHQNSDAAKKEKEASASLSMSNVERSSIERSPQTRAAAEWSAILNEIVQLFHGVQSDLMTPRGHQMVDLNNQRIKDGLKSVGDAMQRMRGLDFDESRLHVVEFDYDGKDLSSVWTLDMRSAFLRMKECMAKMRWLGERSLELLSIASLYALFQTSLSVVSRKDFTDLDRELQEWRVLLKDSPMSSNQREANAFKSENYCRSALSLADARVQCMMCFEDIRDEHERIMQLNEIDSLLLPGTKLHHSAKLIVMQSDAGICVLGTDHRKVDFGTHLYAADDKKAGSKTHVCIVEVVNQTATTMIVSVDPAEGSSTGFSALGPSRVRLYGRSTHQFSFRISDKAVGRICERWRIESLETKLNDCFDLYANIQRLALQLSTEEIDFGVLLASSRQQKRKICIRNVTDLPLLIKGQIQSASNHCSLSMSPEKMLLLPRETQSLEFTLKPSATEESAESTVVIGAVQSFKYLKLKAKINQPRFVFLNEMDKNVSSVYEMRAAKKGKKATACLRVKNEGDVPVAFSIDSRSDALMIEPSAGTVPVGSEMPINLTMKCPDNSEVLDVAVVVSVEGCQEIQSLTILGRWIDPVPAFHEKTVEFKITAEQLVHMVKADERSLELTARNQLINRDDVPVTVYPPTSDDFTFDQPHYSFEGKGEIDFEMTWTVKRLKKQVHSVTFITDTGKKLSFKVNLIWTSGKLEIIPMSWIQLNPVKPGKATRRDIIKINTSGPFSILNKAPRSELIETLSLTELHNGRPIREQDPWLLGSDDMSTVFRSSKQFDISVKAKEGRGWIVEDLSFQTEQAVFVHEDPEKCQLMDQKLTIVAPVSDEPNALTNLMQSCKKSTCFWPASKSAVFCLPNLDILSEMSTSPSTVQSFLLMMLCEVEILQKEWKLTTEQARHILGSDPDEAVSLCASHLKHLEQTPGKRAGSSSNLADYFGKLKGHFEERGHEDMSEICIPLAAVSNAPVNIRSVVQAVYMLLHADCTEKQQWKAAVAMAKTTMPDAFSATQFENTCEDIAELLDQEELTLSDVLTLLNSLMLSDDEEIISLDLLSKILWTLESSDDDANLDQVIASALPEHTENGGMLLQASSPDQSDRLELMMSLVNKTVRQAVDQLCSEDPKAIVSGFCDLALTSDIDLMEDSLISDLVTVLSGKNAQKTNSLGRHDRMDHERSMITQLLKRAKLESVASPLCQLYGYRTEDKAKHFARSITVEALFNILPRCLNERHDRTLKQIKEAALKVSDDPYAPSSYIKDIIIDRALIGINGVKRRLKLKELIKEWIKADPRRDGMESLLKPLIEAVNELLCPDEGSSSETPSANLQLIEEQLNRALAELDAPTISREMDFNELLARVIRFCSMLTDDNVEHKEVANGLSVLAADATKENAVCFCRAIANELSSDSLNNALELLEEGLGDDENLQKMVLHCVMPEQMVDEFDAVIESWSGIDSDVSEEEVFKKMEKLSEPALMTTFRLVGDVLRVKNSVMHMGESEMCSIEGLLRIKTLFDSLAALGCWEKREKSRAAWNILLSASAVGYGAELTFEGLCLAKMSLLLSLTEFYGKGHWMKRESPSCADNRCLQIQIADVPEESPSEDNSEEDEAVRDESTSEEEAKRSADENGEAVVLKDAEWHWLLDSFEVPEEQLVSLEGESSRETEILVTEDASNDQAGDVCAESNSGYMEKLAEVEGILEAVMESVIGASASSSEDSSLRALTFDRIVDGIATVKAAADSWNEIFEEAVRHSHIPKKAEERNADSRVVCTGLSLISQIQFFERYLERCTLFEIPGFVKVVLDGIVQHLNVIPESNLPAEFDKILKEFGVTTVAKGSTTEDFPMPSRHHFLSQTARDAHYGNDYHEGGSSSSCLAAATGNMEEALLVDTMKSDFLKKVTDTIMSCHTSESVSAVKARSVHDQKAILRLKRNPQPSKGQCENAKEHLSMTEDRKIEECSEIKLPSVIEGRTNRSGQGRYFNLTNSRARDLNQTIEIFTHTAVDESMEAIAIDFDIDERATLQSVRDADLAEMYKDAPVTRGDVDRIDVQDPVSAVPVRHDKWTYSLLVESKPFVLFLAEVMRQWEVFFEKFYRSTAEKHEIEWCILVDNSGSMITKEIQMTEALVLMMETLRRLEQPFAIARFGDRKSQQMLKRMDEPFSQLIGQKIIESFSFNEGTYPASAVRHVAEKVWPTQLSENKKLQYHRVMLLITDGLTQERSPEDYISVCKEREFELVVLNLKDEAQKEIMSQIEGLWRRAASCYEVLDVLFVNLLPRLLAGLMIQYMENTLLKIEKNRDQLRSIGQPVISHCGLRNLTLGVDESKLLEDLKKQPLPKLPGNFSKKSFFDCGCATDGVPYAAEMRSLSSTDLKLDVVALDQVERELLRLHQGLQIGTENKEQLKKAEAVWMKAEEWLSVEIAHMVEALDGFLPQNRFTRKRADIQGPSIHLPGFIKHIATQGSEKKIFANKKGGGRSEYSVAVLLDISASMAQGRRRSCALQTVVMLISALKQMNIEDFTVILFGGGIYPIKLPDDAWEAHSIALLFSAVRHRNELSSMDADALLFAAQMLDQSSVRGPKKIFVVTDGNGSCGVRLAGVLQKIEEDLGVDVLAMGVGPEEFFVKKCYPKWITAALPQMVPDALESMSDRMESTARLQKTNQKDTIEWRNIVPFKDGAAETVEEVLRDKETAFPNLLEEMKTEREARLKRGNKPSAFTVDICFALDCTGSMEYWINAAKDEIEVRMNRQHMISNINANARGL